MHDVDDTPTPALYAVEKGSGNSLKYTVVDIYNMDVIVLPDRLRTICGELDLGEDDIHRGLTS